MLVDELNQLHSNYINLSTNHSETSKSCNFFLSLSISVDSGLNNVRLNTFIILAAWDSPALLLLQPKRVRVFAHTQIGANLTSYNKWSVGYFELKLHRHILETPETYITSCKRGNIDALIIIISFFVLAHILQNFSFWVSWKNTSLNRFENDMMAKQWWQFSFLGELFL